MIVLHCGGQKLLYFTEEFQSGNELKIFLCSKFKTIDPSCFYLTSGVKIINNKDCIAPGSNVYCIPRILGGKGGFGSMLRAIGAQIEKTTNREACRDLSGRRLRDINEEKRLKKWISEQAEREKEKAERKRKKLQRLCSDPKFEFSDPNYDKERSEMTEKVHDAVEYGLRVEEASSSKEAKPKPKTKGGLWIDDDLADLTDSSDSESDADRSNEPEIVASTSSTNLKRKSSPVMSVENKFEPLEKNDILKESHSVAPREDMSNEEQVSPAKRLKLNDSNGIQCDSTPGNSN